MLKFLHMTLYYKLPDVQCIYYVILWTACHNEKVASSFEY